MALLQFGRIIGGLPTARYAGKVSAAVVLRVGVAGPGGRTYGHIVVSGKAQLLDHGLRPLLT